MSTDPSFIEYVASQIRNVGDISYRKMFGEYGLYCDGKIVALACDNQLFVKPTEAGRNFIGEVEEAPAYPGAKNSFLVSDQLDDSEWISELIRCTYAALPSPPVKKARVQE